MLAANMSGMSSVQQLREFISERLTAAAEEIFSVFQRTIVQYEEEMGRQRRLLDATWRPDSGFQGTDFPQCSLRKDEIPAEQRLRNQQDNSSLDRLEAAPPEIKEEQEELWSSQGDEQTALKQEADVLMVTPVFEEGDHNEPESNRDQVQPKRPDQEGGWPEDPGPARNTELKERRDRKLMDKESKRDRRDVEAGGKALKSNSGMTTHYRIHTGKLELSKAEQLLMAIADNSEVEDLSDGEEDDPTVDEYVPDSDLLPVEQPPDDSEEKSLPPDSPEEDFNDYSPPDAAENDRCSSEGSDDENRSKQQHPQARKRRRKQDHGEPEPKRREEPQNPEGGACWTLAPFTPNLIQFQGKDDYLKDERADWQPQDYVEQYIDLELMKLLADCTNAMSLAKSGRSLNTSVDEIYHLFGAAILMSCMDYPKTRMLWSSALRIPAVSDAISRDRFFKLSSNLKVVIDDDVPGNKRQTDKFWRVRPFMNRVLSGCRLQARPECLSIDEQMIPFTGASPFQQYVPLKPNPVGIKNFVLASVDGIVLDFEVYQGAQTLSSQVRDSEGMGLGTLVIKRLSETVPSGTKVYCDRFFMSLPAVDHMLKKQVYLTGTVMKNRVPKAMQKLPSDRTLKRQGGGASATVTRADGELCVIKWFDNKPVVMLSAAHGEEPKDTLQRWSKKDKKYVVVARPSIVQEYTTRMGGVGLSDRMMSRYRMNVRTKKWTIRVLMHFTDLALVNSWLLYCQDNQKNGAPRKAMKFLEFRMAVAQVFLNKHDVLNREAHIAGAEGADGCPPQSRKRSGFTLSHTSLFARVLLLISQR